MSGVWFIGDLHFGHKKVSEIRGFSSTSEHDDHIIKKWRKTVRPEDYVHILGDLSGGSNSGEVAALDILSELPGTKHLIAGNHDSISSIHRTKSPNTQRFRDVFDRISDFSRIRMNHQMILMSHYPYLSQGDGPGRGHARYEQYRLPDLGELLIHAHTHHIHPTSGSRTRRELCVSWDAWGRMVGLGDIYNWMSTRNIILGAAL
ncbi:metallophosphoesterase [Microbacterium phage Count]|nr:metallophosphoesterase [Microbacterium phage Count]